MHYYIDLKRKQRNTAGSKAPADILNICRKENMLPLYMPEFPTDRSFLYKKMWLLLVCPLYWGMLMTKVKKDDIVIYQHPQYGNRVSLKFIPYIQKKKKCKFIVLIHDLESLRGGIKGVIDQKESTSLIADNDLLKVFDGIICHNEKMKQYLESHEFFNKKIVNLQIFDYLTDFSPKRRTKDNIPSIGIAGNLARGKSGYIYELIKSKQSLQINLFGINFEDNINVNNVKYCGSFNPDELPFHLNFDFGLVWDGPSIEGCKGNTGEYLMFNNPHKTSLYIVSGIPVIVWRKAAIARFVKENNVGLVVDDLYNLDVLINSISEKKYLEMQSNCIRISKKLKNGYYFIHSLSVLENLLGK